MRPRAIVTLGAGRQARFLAYSGETFRRYALKHGYEYVQGSGAMAEDRPVAWAKIPLLLHLLEAFELVVWIDADAVILDDSVDIASELAPDAWQAMVAHHWGDEVSPNTGVWVLRRGSRSSEFLRAVWQSVEFVDAVFWENAAVMHLLGFTYRTPRRLINPASEWLDGTQWLSEEWNRLTAHSPRLQPARIRHWAGEQPYPLRERQLRADLAHLDGQRLRPALTRVEWVLSKEHPFLHRVQQSVRYRAIEKPRDALRSRYRRVTKTRN
jgi:glycosyl transferase family (putative galactosyltransferase)